MPNYDNKKFSKFHNNLQFLASNAINTGGDLTMQFAWKNGPLNVSLSNGTLNGFNINETMY